MLLGRLHALLNNPPHPSDPPAHEAVQPVVVYSILQVYFPTKCYWMYAFWKTSHQIILDGWIMQMTHPLFKQGKMFRYWWALWCTAVTTWSHAKCFLHSKWKRKLVISSHFVFYVQIGNLLFSCLSSCLCCCCKDCINDMATATVQFKSIFRNSNWILLSVRYERPSKHLDKL